MDNIWYDAEMYNGRGYKDPDGYNTTEYHSSPENKRECPCDTCPLFEQCLKMSLSVVPCVIGAVKVTTKTKMFNGCYGQHDLLTYC